LLKLLLPNHSVVLANLRRGRGGGRDRDQGHRDKVDEKKHETNKKEPREALLRRFIGKSATVMLVVRVRAMMILKFLVVFIVIVSEIRSR